MEKLKGNLSYVFAAALGALNFIFFAIPYISAFVLDASTGISGYSVMSDMWEFDFAGVMSALIAMLILILSVAMLAIGAVGLVKTFVLEDKIPDLKKISDLSVIVYAVLNLLLLVFLIVFVIANTETLAGVEFGYSLSVGIFFSTVVAVASAVALMLLNKKNN